MSRAMEIMTYILTKHVVKNPATLRSIPNLYLQSLTVVIHTLAIVGFDQPGINWYPKVSNQHVNYPTSSALGRYNYEYSAKVQYQEYIHGHLGPSTNFSSPLHCELFEVSLDQLPTYEALSYVRAVRRLDTTSYATEKNLGSQKIVRPLCDTSGTLRGLVSSGLMLSALISHQLKRRIYR